ncbi:chemotaxis protein CheB [Actinoplanes teichomyceticus]|uniref:protein-glutamate methylesterase n=1 Tax=Actinoplanes teichomyceticus TaxID=1867 RepID=A0A561WBF9_ACTTI|nr:chemotaxis protein CheB [Actinoplanes teichomyceticus]TWG21175.1 two-component system chemotaxis response regulator CheB [Actinoplanes teichomyceticus]GIF14996.1 chemotaxis protein CheB [Actinoplanes teichomyceticus]
MSQHRDVIAIGASAGGVEALRALVAGLPSDFPGTVLVVLHIPRDAPSVLPAILTRTGPLVAETAVHGAELGHGRIHVAPHDHHLLVLGNRIRLTRGPTENGHRPAIDPLFRSVARAFGPRAVGVVLSGTRDDGAAGLAGLVARGGTAVVQDPAEALFAAMPAAALAYVPTRHVAPAAGLGGLIARITAMDLPRTEAGPPDGDADTALGEPGPPSAEDLTTPAAGYGCRSCGGALVPFGGGPAPRYRCPAGHAWAPEGLLDEPDEALESALWMALRALEDKAALSRRLATAQRSPESATGSRFRDLAVEAARAGDTIRGLIAQLGPASTPAGEATNTPVTGHP